MNFDRLVWVGKDQKVIDFLRSYPDIIGFFVGNKGQFES